MARCHTCFPQYNEHETGVASQAGSRPGWLESSRSCACQLNPCFRIMFARSMSRKNTSNGNDTAATLASLMIFCESVAMNTRPPFGTTPCASSGLSLPSACERTCVQSLGCALLWGRKRRPSAREARHQTQRPVHIREHLLFCRALHDVAHYESRQAIASGLYFQKRGLPDSPSPTLLDDALQPLYKWGSDAHQVSRQCLPPPQHAIFTKLSWNVPRASSLYQAHGWLRLSHQKHCLQVATVQLQRGWWYHCEMLCRKLAVAQFHPAAPGAIGMTKV